MSIVTTGSLVVHLLFGALWTGSVWFVVVGILPLAGRDGVGPAAVAGITTRLTTVSRVSAVVVLVTGLHLATTAYTLGDLIGTLAGNAVVVMAVLWVVLTGLVEVGASRVDEHRGPQLLYAAGGVAVVVLLDAGVLLATI